MNHKLFIYFSGVVFLVLSVFSQAQIRENPIRLNGEGGILPNDSIGKNNRENSPSDSLKVYIPTIKDYKYWTANTAPQVMDTALTIDAYYKQNIYQRDLFGYQQGPNHGLALNPLIYTADNSRNTILPAGKRYLYMSPEQVKYYNVQTPTTHFLFENGVKEGQYLSTFFTHSPDYRMNYALSFNSLNSRGGYQRQETDDKNFRISFNYSTKNQRYKLLTNVMLQKIQRQESAGINAVGLKAFKDNNDLYSNRLRITPNLMHSDSRFKSKSFYLNHTFGLFKLKNSEDSTQYIYPIKLKNVIELEAQEYDFKEASLEKYYKNLELVSKKPSLLSKKEFKTLKNYMGLQYQWSERLWVDAGAVFRKQILSFNAPNGVTKASYDNNQFGVEGTLKFDFSDKLNLVAETQFLQGTHFGTEYFVKGKLNFALLKNYTLTGGVRLGARKPSFNLLANQSFYKIFNYDHFGFDNEIYQTLFGELSLKPLDLKVSAQVSNILNYTYLNDDYTIMQHKSPVNYFNVAINKRQQFGKFHLDATAQYQMVTAGKEKMPLPNILARATAYYKNNLFGKNAMIMTGLSAYYYTAFKSKSFEPITNEWYLQDEQKIGNYPYVDVFLNIKVRQMRIYIRGENITSFVLPGKYLYTPHQPARDFKVQIGLNWYLFS